MAVHEGITFGNHAVFTYGPLGFLAVPDLWQGHLAEVAFAYTLIVRFGVALALFASARRTFGGVAGFLIAVIVASVADQLGEAVVFLIVAAWAVSSDLDRRHALELAIAAGAFAGMQLLSKESVGATLMALTAVLVMSLPGRRRDYAAAAAAALVVALLAGWVATGQDLGALPDYVRNSERIISGYSAAMSITVGGTGWQATAALVGLLLGLWGALHMTVGKSARQRWGVAALWVTLWYFAFKDGFVRHEPGHATVFFDALLGGYFAFRWRSDHRLPALAGAGALLALALAAQGHSITAAVDPSGNLRTAIDQIETVLSSTKRAATMAAARAQIEASEPVDTQTLSLLKGHTTDVYPWEIALAWAHRLDWDPLPVLQSYSAYTTGLDEVDAHFLASRLAPQRILLQNVTDIDTRVLAFDQGVTSRTILCRYDEMRATPTFAVLGHGRNRCSAPTLVTTVRADWGCRFRFRHPPTATRSCT